VFALKFHWPFPFLVAHFSNISVRRLVFGAGRVKTPKRAENARFSASRGRLRGPR
jgi:hypothetical protein